MDVGKRITELRNQSGLTTNRLANLCGLSQSFVRAVELGEKGITVENLALICEALHISLCDFFRASENPDPDDLHPLIERLSAPQRSALSAFLKTML